jgi:hypothetical protein
MLTLPSCQSNCLPCLSFPQNCSLQLDDVVLANWYDRICQQAAAGQPMAGFGPGGEPGPRWAAVSWGEDWQSAVPGMLQLARFFAHRHQIKMQLCVLC